MVILIQTAKEAKGKSVYIGLSQLYIVKEHLWDNSKKGQQASDFR